MDRKLFLINSVFIILLISGCKKETYDMRLLSEKGHLTPTIVISAVKNDISFRDIFKSGDTIVFDQNNLVKIIFKEDSVLDLTLTDFKGLKNIVAEDGKGILIQKTAIIESRTINLDIDEFLSHITGTLYVANPSIKLSYTNYLANPVSITLNITGRRADKTLSLGLAPFTLNVTPPDVKSLTVYTIDKTNSSLPEFFSLPPAEIKISGVASINSSGKGEQSSNLILENNRLIGSLEAEVPLDLRMKNIQFTKTFDNFLKDDGKGNDSQFKPENFKRLSIKLNAKNGFPLGVSVKMSLINSATNSTISTVDASGIIESAPINSTGKSTGKKETTTTIEFSSDFFKSVNKADKITFWFTLNTAESGSRDVKIYSDYSIDFTAALVMKPDINF
jgi:hypothetical protein